MSAVPVVWTMISFIFFIAAVVVIFPARREFKDAMREVNALGAALDGTRVIAEAELSVRYYMFLAQVTGGIVMAIFLLTGITALLLPSPESASGELRAAVLPWFLISAETLDGILQTFLLLATYAMRSSRQKWREVAEDHGIQVAPEDSEENNGQ